MTGNGGSSSGLRSSGIELAHAGTLIDVEDGDINLAGAGGTGLGGHNHGVFLHADNTGPLNVQSTGKGNIEIIGVGNGTGG